MFGFGGNLKNTKEKEHTINYFQDINYSFKPGETIGIIPSNDDSEVELLISLLNLENVADRVYSLSVLKETTKKNPSIPKHIPETGTIKYILTHCLDIRGPPSKVKIKNVQYSTTHLKWKYLLFIRFKR